MRSNLRVYVVLRYLGRARLECGYLLGVGVEDACERVGAGVGERRIEDARETNEVLVRVLGAARIRRHAHRRRVEERAGRGRPHVQFLFAFNIYIYFAFIFTH